MAEFFTYLSDIIILVAAVLAAIAGIYKFITGFSKGVKNKVDETKEHQEAELNAKIDARIKMTTQPMLD